MSKSQWSSLLIWVGAVLIIIFATVFYRPAAASTGSLLIWMKGLIYVMDIDTLVLQRVGPAMASEVMAPAPGCFGQTDTPCWVTAGRNVYEVSLGGSTEPNAGVLLPLGEGFRWADSAISWSPDGMHLAYGVLNEARNRVELRVYNAATAETRPVFLGADPEIAPAWTAGCAAGLTAADCQLAFKTRVNNVGVNEARPRLVALTLATGVEETWRLSSESIFELRWRPDGQLLYSRPKRHFRYAHDGTPAYAFPSNSRLANMSPDARFTVYYQPFTLQGCQADTADGCLNLGVWLANGDNPDNPGLIYNVELAQSEAGGLNFIPTWSPRGHAFVFFQEGKLIHYDVPQQEATIWYKPVQGKLRSIPVFSPDTEAVAFIDDQGQGFSEYRLVVVNPRLQPIEHIIDTQTGIRLLAWLPN
jgi:hypothetical protein